MKKSQIALISALIITASMVNVKIANAADFTAPQKIRCTCYTSTEGKTTASGEPVREGIIAGKRAWMGKTAILYDLNMNIIGFYEFKDTGAGIDTDGDGKGDSIINGKSVDVYRNTMDGCREWIRTYGDFVYMVILDAEG